LLITRFGVRVSARVLPSAAGRVHPSRCVSLELSLFKQDIWTTGILLFEMLTGNVPFAATNRKELYQQTIQV
jgi:serine/threonine protein kinase